jgi:hypothetical protein
MVPPGTHLISYNSASGQGDFGPTTSFFLPLAGGQVGAAPVPQGVLALLLCGVTDIS